MSFQQCQFNFGATPFKYPPTTIRYSTFNEFGELSEDQKVILPRHKRLAALSQMQVSEDSCTLCFDNRASVTLLPCTHRGFCMKCAIQLELCPMCRQQIEKRETDS
ncbi:hypothetical protein NP493_119g10089 [Ridgeia piscesae]|uniref:RING-type domain-containing protein n=1 Tax=Ridgeia piscesae TaxID=27915 RepID=A0AAD9UGU2_RIDPI|nr:hypothetical protein NP493_119g10089 [Ridgeia piscesae]